MNASILRRNGAAALAFALLFVLPLAAGAQEAAPEPEVAPLDWQIGPTTGSMGGGLAEIQVPEGFMFLGKAETQRLLELMQNPVSGTELATVSSVDEESSWFLFFEWDAIGYVDDSERDELDADALLQSLVEGTEAGNVERRKRGWPELHVEGWTEAPHYDVATQNLTWAVKANSEGVPIINRMTKVLGRRGVMTVTLVADPNELIMASAAADQLMGGYAFQPGNTYAEFVPGTDQMAKVGLAALVVGGAGAALLKSGLLARFWKLIVVAVIGLGAGLKRLFSGPKHIAEPPNVG
ncbi:MAG: DUF2167 domain-containing protein [Myxococcota bacterium]|nr:DUF2167 domain-containing protein [Myxococcota bacterium]